MDNCQPIQNKDTTPMRCGICLNEIVDERYRGWVSCEGKGYPIKYNYWHKDCEPTGGEEVVNLGEPE